MDAANAANLVVGGYAALRYLRHFTLAIDETLTVPSRIIRARNAIVLGPGRDDDFAAHIQAGFHQLLDCRTVVERPDGTLGLSPGRVTADGIAIPHVQGPPRLRLV
jgi:hypothetical protein